MGMKDLAEAVMDVLLPGDGLFPAARDTDLAARVMAHDRFGATLAPVLEALPAGFRTLDPEGRALALAQVEAAVPAAFGALVTGAYSLYYTHPGVAAVIARLSGTPPGPPQPRGHDLAPFDPALVAVPAARGPLYREVPQ